MHNTIFCGCVFIQCSYPKNIALIFQAFNLLEIKGFGSSVSTDSYYKMIEYAGLFIDQTGKSNQYSALDVSLTFLSLHYPRKLIKHLREERKLTVANTCSGVYHINKETFVAQIIVTTELPPEDNLYLRCLTDKFNDIELANRLADDYKEHQDEELYRRYLHQLMVSSGKTKGDVSMYICEGLLNFFGTSSEEIIERTQKEADEYYLPKIDYLKSLLIQHNIPFDLEMENNARKQKGNSRK